MKKYQVLVLICVLAGMTTFALANQQARISGPVQLRYDDGIEIPSRDEGPDWIFYDDARASGLITGNACYWSKVIFEPVSDFQLQGISLTPLNQGPNFNQSCLVRVYSVDGNYNLEDELYEFEIDRVNEWGEDAEHFIELEEDEYLDFAANEEFCIMYNAPAGPYQPGNGRGWWNLYDGANNGRRSFFATVGELDEDPPEAHNDWQATGGDLLLRANGEYLEGFTDLAVAELYEAELNWMAVPGTERMFVADLLNNGMDIEEFVISFQVYADDGEVVWEHEMELNGIEEGDEITVECDQGWEVPDELGLYSVWVSVTAEDDADEENDFGYLDQIVFNPAENAALWLGYTDGDFESTTAWNEDSGWAVAFHHPGGDIPALGLDAFRVAISSEEVIECDFAVHILDLEEGLVTPVWEGTSNCRAGGINWIEIEPEFEEEVAIVEGLAFMVTYFFQDGTRFPEDNTPPFAGTNNQMPFAMLQTQDDGEAYGFAAAGDFPIEAQLSYTDWIPDGPHLAFDPEILEFGFGLELNRDYTINARLVSFGNEPVEVDIIRIAPSARAYITVNPAQDIVIEPGEAAEIEITFRTNEDVELDTRLLVSSNGEIGNMLWELHASTSEVEDFPHRILIENFTSSTCGPCARYAPDLEAALEDAGDLVVPIAYHVWWPGDSDPWFQDNPQQVQDLVEFYGVRGIPSWFLDGGALNARTAETILAAIEARGNERTPVGIDLSGAIENDELTVDVSVVSFENYDNLTLRTALIEDHVEFRGPNGLPDHYDAMVRMLPDAAGENFDIEANERVNFEFSLDLDGVGWHELDQENLVLVAWVQEADRDVLQAENYSLGAPLDPPQIVTDPEENGEIRVALGLDDDPVVETVTISNVAEEGAGNLIVTIETEDEVDWLSIRPDREAIAPGAEADIDLMFTTDDLDEERVYETDLVITCNDPNNAEVSIHLVLDVTGVPELRHFDDYTVTDANHSLLVLGFTFDDEPVPTGWEIGVFTPGGILAGAAVWEQGQRIGISAFGDDQDTPNQVEGFHADEQMILRVWDDVEDVEYRAQMDVIEGRETWLANGFTVLNLAAFGTRDLTVELHDGWNMISINIVPTGNFFADQEDPGPDIRLMWEQLDGDEGHLVRIFKDEIGHFYSPEWDFNNIPFWNLTQGYQVKLNDDAQAIWTGMPIEPNAEVPIEEGWNIIAYFPQYDLDADDPDFYVLSPIIEDVISAKDWRGRFMSPAFRFSNMDPWTEGQGYQIKMEADRILQYPPEENNLAALNLDFAQESSLELTPTGENMSVLVQTLIGLDADEGDEIQAFNTEGQMIGVGRVDADGRCGLAVWGDDLTTETADGLLAGDSFNLKLLKKENTALVNLSLTSKLEGQGFVYEPNGLTVIEVKATPVVPQESYLAEAYPNPFNSTAKISYGLPETQFVRLGIYDLNGRLIQTLTEGVVTAGNHQQTWHAGTVPSGIYLIQLESNTQRIVKEVLLMR